MFNPYYSTIMTKQEFENRTGLKVSAEEFDNINEMYLDSPFDKNIFCEDYKEHGKSKLVKELHRQNTLLRDSVQVKRNSATETARLLIGKSRAYDDADLRKEAVRLVGEKRVVLLTMELGLSLWEDDIKYIQEHLA